MGRRDLLFLSIILGGAACAVGPIVAGTGSGRGSARPAAATPGHGPVVDAIDRALRAGPAGASAPGVRRAADLQIARRLTLALTGTIPSLAEVRAFEAMPEGDRLERRLDALLVDRRTADYLAERLARAFVGVEGGPFLVYRRRRFVAWLSDEIRANRPYDRLVRALIADGGLGTDHPATNFVTVTYDPDAKAYDPERLAGRVARVFLGIRLDCAQCHDHPFDSWRRADFQGLAAFFGQVESGFSGVHDGSGEFRGDARSTPPGAAIAPRVPFDEGLLPGDGTRRERLAGWVTDPGNRHFRRATVNRVWAILAGRPLVEPIDDLAGAGTDSPALDRLADDFAGHGFDLRRLIRVIAATDAYRADSAWAEDDATPSTAAPAPAWGRTFPVSRLRPEQVAGALAQAGTTAPIDHNSPILVRLANFGGINDFIARHGDLGGDEFEPAGLGTIPQRLLLMNGDLVGKQVHGGLGTAAGQVARLAPDDRIAIEAAFLATLTRRPTADEVRHFSARLAADTPEGRPDRLTDLFWVLVNSTEFSTNH